jgi:sulfur carrier protein ThiS
MLREYVEGQAEVTAEAGQSVREALKALGIPPELVALVSDNGAHQMKDYILQDGDEVRLLAVIGGG